MRQLLAAVFMLAVVLFLAFMLFSTGMLASWASAPLPYAPIQATPHTIIHHSSHKSK